MIESLDMYQFLRGFDQKNLWQKSAFRRIPDYLVTVWNQHESPMGGLQTEKQPKDAEEEIASTPDSGETVQAYAKRIPHFECVLLPMLWQFFSPARLRVGIEARSTPPTTSLP
jgi:hypothetical protein